jgi:hypothetical protein
LKELKNRDWITNIIIIYVIGGHVGLYSASLHKKKMPLFETLQHETI